MYSAKVVKDQHAGPHTSLTPPATDRTAGLAASIAINILA